MKLLIAREPPALVVKEIVATLEALPATRSVDDTASVGLVTLSPIWPDAMSVGLALASAVVWIEIELAPAATAPMVSPFSVTVTGGRLRLAATSAAAAVH